MLIPGELIAILTFPGVIVHELGHKLFCEWTGVKVREVCYFRFGNPAGYVVHEKLETFKQTFAITAGPFIIGTALAILFFITSMFFYGILGFVFLWLGASAAMNCFPSSGDANNLWKETKKHTKDNLLAVIGYPVSIIIWIANALSVIWFDLFYAIGIYALSIAIMTFLGFELV